MPKVIARRCRFTNKLFDIDDRDEFKAHLIKLRKKQSITRFEKRLKINFKHYKKELSQQPTLYHALKYLIDHQVEIVQSYIAKTNAGVLFDDDKLPIPSCELFDSISINRIRYDKRTSNSHSAPIGRSRNFARKSNVRQGYPAINGHISFTVSDDFYKYKCSNRNNFSYSGLLSELGFHTGSGGSANGTKYGYGVTIWIEDFTHMYQQLIRERVAYRYDLNSKIIKWKEDAFIAKIKGKSNTRHPRFNCKFNPSWISKNEKVIDSIKFSATPKEENKFNWTKHGNERKIYRNTITFAENSKWSYF